MSKNADDDIFYVLVDSTDSQLQRINVEKEFSRLNSENKSLKENLRLAKTALDKIITMMECDCKASSIAAGDCEHNEEVGIIAADAFCTIMDNE